MSRQEEQFDSYCKAVLCNALIDYQRKMNRRKQNECFLEDYSGTLVKTKIDKFLNVSGSRHCSIEQQCREVALCWRDVPDG